MQLTELQNDFLRVLKQNLNRAGICDLKGSEIIELMEKKPSSLYQLIRSLEKKGLIKTESNYEAGKTGMRTKITVL